MLLNKFSTLTRYEKRYNWSPGLANERALGDTIQICSNGDSLDITLTCSLWLQLLALCNVCELSWMVSYMVHFLTSTSRKNTPLSHLQQSLPNLHQLSLTPVPLGSCTRLKVPVAVGIMSSQLLPFVGSMYNPNCNVMLYLFCR